MDTESASSSTSNVWELNTDLSMSGVYAPAAKAAELIGLLTGGWQQPGWSVASVDSACCQAVASGHTEITIGVHAEKIVELFSHSSSTAYGEC
ncbi:hypothetical protein COB72_00985 [bacterium]|nr:MAG: hypothetical protein COB72_00985 [bacterium]